MAYARIKQQGFTLIEVMISVAIIAVLLALSSVNFGQSQSAVNVATATDRLLADIKSQQSLAMAGEMGSAMSAQPHGIFIQSNQYTLYAAPTFSSGDSNNFALSAPSSITFSSTLPGSTLLFDTGSGSVHGFVNGSNTITVSGVGGARTITIDRFGATTVN